MKYELLGEYHAFMKQAKSAAEKRFAILHNLAEQIRSLAADPTRAIDAETEAIGRAITEAKAAEFEMTAAIGCINETAKLCEKETITASSFKR